MANIDHLGIAVRSIEQAQRIYQALGLTVLKEEEEDEGVRSVMIPLGDSRLRLLEPLDKTTSVAQVPGATWRRLTPRGSACGRHLGHIRRDEAGGLPAAL